MLSFNSPVMDYANLKDHQKGSSSLVVECLEKVLCLPEDMQKLRSIRKRKVFLSLKRDFVKVHDHLFLFSFFFFFLSMIIYVRALTGINLAVCPSCLYGRRMGVIGQKRIDPL